MFTKEKIYYTASIWLIPLILGLSLALGNNLVNIELGEFDTENQNVPVFYTSTDEITGFQFFVVGMDVIGVSGGVASENNFFLHQGATCWRNNDCKDFITGFSTSGMPIPPGSGTLLYIDYAEIGDENFDQNINVHDQTCLDISEGFIFGNTEDGNLIEFEVDTGCSSSPQDCAGDYYGSAIEDSCGVCSGGNSGHELNSDIDCNGICFGSSLEDDCGNCDADYANNCFTHEIDLYEGANLISFHALPENSSVQNSFSDLGSSVSHILGNGNGAVNFNGNWYGSLQEISPFAGYWVVVNEATTLSLPLSIPVYSESSEMTYQLEHGNNLISYPFAEAQSLTGAISEEYTYSIWGIAGNGEAAIRIDNDWFGSLESFQPSSGYWMVANHSFDFQYILPEENSNRSRRSEDRSTPPELFNFNQSPFQAFYWVNAAHIDGNELIVGEDWIGTFNGDVCIGARPWNGIYTDVPVMGFDEDIALTEGYIETGQTPKFVVYDASEDAYYDAKVYDNHEFEGALLAMYTVNEIVVERDCAGVLGGDAELDNCDVCDSNPDNDCPFDCEGIPGGNAFEDDCGVCSGGTTGHEANSDKDDCGVCFGENQSIDCNGDCFGTALIDDCAICSGGFSGHTPNSDKDCNGDCFGTALIDDCAICSEGNSGHESNSDKDCYGDCFGEAIIDDCGVCSEGNSGHESNSDKDCNDDCFGDALIETYYYDFDGDGLGSETAQEFCNADPPSAWVNNSDDIDDNCFSNFHDCMGVCDGSDEFTLYYQDEDGDGLGSDVTAHFCSGEVPVGWVLNADDPDDACTSNYFDCGSVCDGLDSIQSFCYDFDGDGLGSGSTQEFCSNNIPSSWVSDCSDPYENCFSNQVDCAGVCDGEAILQTYYFDNDGDGLGGELSEEHCNALVPTGWVANSDDIDDDCYSNYLDCAYVCNGFSSEQTYYYDNDGDGLGSSQSSVFCSAFVEEGWVENNDDLDDNCFSNILDCEGTCDGTVTIDACGICGGDDSSCADCAGIPNGNAVEDNCGVCDENPSNDCVQDCSGEWGGTLVLDACGICGGDDSFCADCAGIPNGNAVEDNCGVCDDDPSNDCVQDCAGEWGGSLELDACGECGGDDSTCLDACGIPNGNNACVDECGIPFGDNTSCADCQGIPNGDAYIDDCGICDDDTENDNTPLTGSCDCAGVPNGEAAIDNCGVCDNDPDNDCPFDCAGVPGGEAIIDNCGICSEGTTGIPANTDIDECGVCFGTGPIIWYVDADGDGLGDSISDTLTSCEQPEGYADNLDDPHLDCYSNVMDECGVCDGDNASCADCAGIPYGSAFTDDCGVCSGGTSDHQANSDMDFCGVCFGNNEANVGCGCFLDPPENYWYDFDNDGLGICTTENDVCLPCESDPNCVSFCSWELPDDNWADNTDDEDDECHSNSHDCAGDCDGGAIITAYWFDNDGDGLGVGDSLEYCSAFVPENWVDNNEDIDDNCFSNFHDCAGVCDGSDLLQSFFFDNDGDGLGGDLTEEFCTDFIEDGWVLNSDDLDDNCFSNYFDCADVCNGFAQEGLFYSDNDGDGLGDAGSGEIFCSEFVPPGWVDNNEDPDDDCQSNAFDCAGECDGNALYQIYYFDNDGDGLGSDIGIEFCSGLVTEEWVENNEDIDDNCFSNILDCAGICNGITEVDECGICGGDDSSCADCAGVPNGTATEDNCGVCDSDSENDCIQDCNNVWGGNAYVDECGVCDNDPENDNVDMDCTGECFGNAYVDDCGICDDDASNDNADMDCSGECFGIATMDDCGVCDDDVSNDNADMDCNGECFGDAYEDDCGVCDDDASNDNANMDCNGECFGDAIEDNCGFCDSDLQNDCVQDCAGIWGGDLELDDCGVCGGDNSSCSGCTDSDAFNYDCLSGQFPPCNNDVTIDDGSCIFYPEEFLFDQSQSQALYFINDAYILESSIQEDLVYAEDWVGVFKDSVCVGSYPWTGINTTLPAMGNDGNPDHEYYLEAGDFPLFKIYDSSEDDYLFTEVEITKLNGQEYNGFENLGFFIVHEMIGLGPDCSGVESGNAFLDDCGVCICGILDSDETPNGCFEGIPNVDLDCNDVCDPDTPVGAEQAQSGVVFGAYIDDCGICSEGGTGHVADSDDLGCGCFNPPPADYYLDIDSDGFGAGDISYEFCETNVTSLYADNNLDPEPNCPNANLQTLNVDDCGDCVGVDVSTPNQNMDVFSICCSPEEKDDCGICFGDNSYCNSPTAFDQSIEILEDQSISVTLNGSDPNQDELSFQILDYPFHGILTGANAEWSFTPEENFNGLDSFTFIATDGSWVSEPGTISFTIIPVNDAPIAENTIITLDEDSSIEFTLPGYDVDGDDLSYSLDAAAENGLVTLSGEVAVYTPIENYFGQDAFTFTVHDGTLSSTPGTVSLEVRPIGDAPVIPALADTSISEGDTLRLVITANDVDGDELHYFVSTSGNSYAAFEGNELTLIPNNNYNGDIEVTVTVTDGEFDTSDTFTVTVFPKNDPPQLAEISYQSVLEDSELTIEIAAVDPDGDFLTFSADADIPETELSISNNTLSVLPPPDFNGDILISVFAFDGEFTVGITFTLSVLPVNDTPLIISLPVAETEQGNLYEYHIETEDVDGDELSLHLSASPNWLSLTGNYLSGIPSNEDVGDHEVVLTVSDYQLVSTQSFTLSVNDVNDPPFVFNIDAVLNEDEPLNIILNGGDPDEDSITYSIDTEPAYGSIQLTGSDVLYVPEENYNGNDSFSYRASDGLLTSEPALVSLDILPVNDAPTMEALADTSIDEGSEYIFTLNTGDVDGDALLIDIATEGNAASEIIDNEIHILPPALFNGDILVTVTVSDGLLQVSDSFILTVNAVNDPPEISALDNQSILEDSLLELDVFISDPDEDELMVVVESDNANGVVENGILRLTPHLNFYGETQVTITASDGELEAAASFILTVVPVNDPPQVTTVIEDITVNEGFVDIHIDLTQIFSDPENGNNLIYSVSHSVSALHAVIENSQLILSSVENQFGNGLIEVTASDNVNRAVASTSFYIEILPVNDPPVVTPFTLELEEDTQGTFEVEVQDAENDEVTLTIVQQPAFGNITETGDGIYHYSPEDDFFGVDSFILEVSDGTNTVQEEVSVTIVPVNDEPIILNDSLPDALENAFYMVEILVEDIDNTIPELELSLESAPGWLSLNGKILSGTPGNFDSGNYEVILELSDGESSVSKALSLYVENVNAAPIVENFTVNVVEDGSVEVELVATDAEGDEVFFNYSTPMFGDLTGTAPILTYTPHPDFFGEDSFTYTASDGQSDSDEGIITIQVIGVNDIPTAEDLTFNMDNFPFPMDFSTSVTDVDGDALTILTTPPSPGEILNTIFGGTLTPTGDLTYEYNPPNPQPEADFMLFKASDGVSETGLQIATFNFQGRRWSRFNPPTAFEDAINSTEDTDKEITFVGFDVYYSFPLDGSEYVEITQYPQNGSLSVPSLSEDSTPSLAQWTATFSPDDNYTGPDEIRYRVINSANSNGQSAEAIISLNINEVNDLPVIGSLSDLIVEEDNSISFNVNVTDIDNDLTLSAISSSEDISIHSGAVKKFIHFDGNDDHIVVPHNNTQIVGEELTIEAWVLPNDDQWSNIMMKGDYGYGIALSGDVDSGGCGINRTLVLWDQYYCGQTIRSSLNYSLNTWQHVAVTVRDLGNQLEVYFYLNGVEDGPHYSSVNSISNGNNDDLYIGSQGSSCACNYFQGNMDDIRLWSEVRSREDINNNLNGLSAESTPNLIGQWNGNNSYNSILSDITGNGNEGIIYGAEIITETADFIISPQPNYFGTSTITVTASEVDYHYEQSTSQAFYFITSAEVNGAALEAGDRVIAYRPNEYGLPDGSPVGGAIWSGANTDVVVMGNDGSDYTSGYLQPGEIPVFRIYSASGRKLVDVNAGSAIAPFTNTGTHFVESLLSVVDCAGILGGHAYLNGINECETDIPAEYNILTTVGGESVSELFVLDVLPVNDAPELEEIESVTFNEDDESNLSLSATDVDYVSLSYTAQSGSENILAEISGNLLTVKGSPNFYGTGEITVSVADNEGASDSQTFQVQINSVNDSPVLNSLPDIQLSEDGESSFEVSAEDIDSEDLQFSVSNSAHLQSTIVNNLITVIPEPNWYGIESVIVSVSDGELSQEEAVTVTVNPINDAPQLSTLNDVEINEDSSVDIFLSAEDIDSNNLSFAIQDADGISALITGNILSLTPPENFFGTAVITVSVADGEFTDSDNFTLTVKAVNDAPIVSQPLEDMVLLEDAEAATMVLSDVFSDIDGDALIFQVSTDDGDLISAQIEEDILNITPLENQHGGPVIITVTASDNNLAAVSDIFTITIEAVNDMPVLSAIPDQEINEGEYLLYTLEAEDVDGDDLEYQVVTIPETSASLIGNNLTITPSEEFNGDIECTVSVSDGEFTDSDNFTLTVKAVNDAPIVSQPLEDLILLEDAGAVAMVLSEVFTDIDEDILSYTVSIIPEGIVTAAIEEDILRVSTIENVFGGPVTITVFANDLNERAVTSDAFQVTVSPVNDAPSAENMSVTLNEDGMQSIITEVEDIDNSQVEVDIVSGAAFGEIEVVGNIITYVPHSDYFGEDTILYRAFDGELYSAEALLSIVVTPVNDAPVIIPAPDQEIAEGGEFALILSANDVDGDDLLFSASSDESILVNVENSRLTISSVDENFNGTVLIQTQVTDGQYYDSDVFELTFTPVNDPPELTPVADQEIDEDGIFLYSIQSFDVDGDNLILNVETNSENAEFSLNGSLLTVSPAENYNGDINLTIMVSDNEFSVTDDFTLTVKAVNDAPIVSQPLEDLILLEDAGAAAMVLADYFSDIDGDSLAYSVSLDVEGIITASILNGELIINTLQNQFGGPVSLNVIADDLKEDSTPAQDQFEITVEPVNDPPNIISQPAAEAYEDETFEYQIEVDDVDDDFFYYGLLSHPEGMAVDSSGLITWTPVEGVLSSGLVGIVVWDRTAPEPGIDLPDYQEFSITVIPVNDPPVVVSTPPAIATEDIEYEYQIEVSDPDDTEFVFELVEGPQGMVLSDAGRLTWTPVEGVLSSGNITILVSDGGEDDILPTEHEFIIVVIPVNDPPAIISTPEILQLMATDTFFYQILVEDIDDESFDYFLQNAPEGMTVNEDGFIFWIPEYAGEYGPIRVVVTDGGEDGVQPAIQELFITVTPYTDLITMSWEFTAPNNLISFLGVPGDSSVATVLEPLGETAYGIIGEGNASVYNNGEWIGSLKYIQPDDGYWLTLNIDPAADTTIYYSVAAHPTDPNLLYSLHEGNNLISYVGTDGLSITDALPDDAEPHIRSISTASIATTQLDDGTWIGSLQHWNVLKGYWVYVELDGDPNTNDMLEFSFENTGLIRKEYSSKIFGTVDIPADIEYVQSTRQAFYFMGEIQLAEYSISPGEWIVATLGDAIVGARQYSGDIIDIPVMGADFHPSTQAYCKFGDMPIFKLYRPGSGEFVELIGDITPWNDNGMHILGVMKEKVELPHTFKLSDPYPNPFNPATQFTFEIPQDDEVQLSIYDLQGRIVTTLYSGEIKAGYHELQWNAASQASGVYFIKLSSSKTQLTKKIVLMK